MRTHKIEEEGGKASRKGTGLLLYLPELYVLFFFGKEAVGYWL
jgi:hypothetical protein